ncbi:MAG: hypothetical protein AAF471_03695 [Myxococcota bacterium]
MNSPDKMPCCMHPVTFPCVDDEHKSLLDLAGGISLPALRYALCRFQLRAEEMLELANADYAPVDPVRTIYNDKRFDMPGGFVLDYDMGKGQINGLEFCARVRRSSIRRITWSRHLPNEDALKAVNKGQLHGSVKKDARHSVQEVSKLIEQAIPAFFCQETGTFAKVGEQADSALKDPLFVKWFAELLRARDFSEHYLLDPAGTLMLAGPNKEIYGLRALTARQLDKEAEQAQKCGAPNYVAQSLKNHDAALCLPRPDQQQITPEIDWLKCMYPITETLSGGQQAYFLCHGANLLVVDTGKVFSVAQYREANPY